VSVLRQAKKQGKLGQTSDIVTIAYQTLLRAGHMLNAIKILGH
jgi:hypothetical protein